MVVLMGAARPGDGVARCVVRLFAYRFGPFRPMGQNPLCERRTPDTGTGKMHRTPDTGGANRKDAPAPAPDTGTGKDEPAPEKILTVKW